MAVQSSEDDHPAETGSRHRCWTAGDIVRSAVGCILILTMISVHGESFVSMAIQRARSMKPKLFMKAPERAENDGYRMETHHVQTDDGYILGLHRIPGKRESSKPVLLQHGQHSMSDCWIAFGPSRSLAYQLADKGYDVWLGNIRGNIYSKDHTTLNPSDSAFWNFSWHEMGFYDLPAMIDYILRTTGQSKLYYMGHSLGGRIVFVLLSMRPEYNDKLRLVVAMASRLSAPPDQQRTPEFRPPRNVNLFQRFVEVAGINELFPYSERRIAMLYYFCSNSITRAICRKFVQDSMGESEVISEDDILMMIVIGMGGNSAKTSQHYTQLIESGRFQQFDYGPEVNLQMYGSNQPAEYDVTRVTAPVSIHYGATDKRVPEEGVLYMSTILPNVAEVRKVPSEKFNHMDFICHMNLKELLYDHILSCLENY
ncbi:lipase 3 isoform X2 [Anabrus simplex]|uniref:lipase 3 isoform X2 n=1 Tax=Anabrus simplex TaxID=316456 RepID=UPI0035A261AD